MSELTVSQIIKLILGVLVVVAVVAGISLFFKERIFTFFDVAPTGDFWRAFQW